MPYRDVMEAVCEGKASEKQKEWFKKMTTVMADIAATGWGSVQLLKMTEMIQEGSSDYYLLQDYNQLHELIQKEPRE